MSFGSAGFFKHAIVSSVGKLTAVFIAIINFGRQESHLQSTQYEPRSHAQNTQPTISGDRRPVCDPRRCIPITIGLLNLVGDD